MRIINRRIEEEPELRSVYVTALTSKVGSNHKNSALKALRDAYYDNLQTENWANMAELARFLEKVIVAKNQELIMSLLKDNWKETFGALDYSPSNYNPLTGKFRVRLLHFMENEAKMMPSRAAVPPDFVRQVELRFRALFLFDFVMLSHFSEESMMFVATVDSAKEAHEFHQHAAHGDDPR
jgi:hypothetical protein